MTDESIRIRPVSESDSMAELTALLHRAYAELGEKGFPYTAVDQSEKTTRARMLKGQGIVAELDGELVGTVTYYAPGKNPACEWYRLPRVAVFGQFGVDPDRRGMGIGSGLIEVVMRLARRDGAREIALDTAEDAKALVDMYDRMGFRVVGHDDWNITNYRSVIMSRPLS